MIHKISLYKKILLDKGFILTCVYVLNKIINKCFGKLVFGRLDVSVVHDLRISGTDCMQIGRSFSMGRGGWLYCLKEFGDSVEKQIFKPQLRIGDHVSIGEYVHIGCAYHIEIGNNVLMASKIYIADHNHGSYRGEMQSSPDVPPVKRELTYREVIIGDNVWLGEFVSIMPGVTIGRGSIIGAHSTVTHNIPPRSIAVGSPAQVIKQWNNSTKMWEKV